MHFAAACDVDRLTRNVFRAAQIDYRLADIGRRLLALQERVACNIFVERGFAIHSVLSADERIEYVGPHRSAEKSGAYRVDANVQRPQLFRERLGEADPRELSRAIRRRAAMTGLARHRRDIHDRALA